VRNEEPVASELARVRLRSSRKPVDSVLLKHQIDWLWDRFALQREQAPSTQQ